MKTITPKAGTSSLSELQSVHATKGRDYGSEFTLFYGVIIISVRH
jgi:hypothetical protein